MDAVLISCLISSSAAILLIGVIACVNFSRASFPDFELLPEFFSHATEPSVVVEDYKLL